MEDTNAFSEVIGGIKNASRSKNSDPKSLRLAAVTAALLEVLQDNVSASKVYAASVTALERTLDNESEVDFSTQIALLELLSLTIPHVRPAQILKATFPLTSRVFRAVVATAASPSVTASDSDEKVGGPNAVLRWSARASSEYIIGLGDCKGVEEKAVIHFLNGTLLCLVKDRRPKVRKSGQGCIADILRRLVDSSGNGIIEHIVTKQLNIFVHKGLKHSLQEKIPLDELLHMLSFLEATMVYLNISKISKDLMEILLKLFQSSTFSGNQASDFVSVKVRESTPTVVSVNAILAVFVSLLDVYEKHIFSFQSIEIDEFVPRLLATLLQAQPMIIFRDGAADSEILLRGKTLFGQVIIRCMKHLSETSKDVIIKLLPVAIQFVILVSKNSDVDTEDHSVAQTLLIELTQYFREQLPILRDHHSFPKCFRDVLSFMEQLLDTSFRSSWDVALKSIVVLILCNPADDHVPVLFDTLIRLRNDVSTESLSQNVVEDAVATLIQGVPLPQLWEWIDWRGNNVAPQLAAKEGISNDRAWILGVMKTSLSTAQPESPLLSFFKDHILALARDCDRMASLVPRDKIFHQSNVLSLWSLFPLFCSSPTDTSETMPLLTETLVKALSDKRYPGLIPVICDGLSNLVESSKPDLELVGGTLQETAKMLLPALFRLATDDIAIGSEMGVVEEADEMTITSTSENGRRMQSLSNAISSLVCVARSDFVHGMYKKLMQKLLEEMQSEDQNSERLSSFLFLAQALAATGKLNDSSIALLYRTVKALLKEGEFSARIQKRAYKVLLELCSVYHSFVTETERLRELSKLLTETITSANVSARAMRLRCMIVIVQDLDASDLENLPDLSSLVAEILLCLKDTNAKTREFAYQLLLTLAKKDDLPKFLNATTAALGAQTPHMRSAAVMALSRLVYEFAWENEDLHSILPSLLQTVLVLINENSREVIKSVVGFIRVCVTAIEPSRLEELLPDLVQCLLTYQKHKDRFRAKIKIILKKLVKKFGYEKIMPFVPESEVRLLTHMRKLDERQKRRNQGMDSSKTTSGFDDLLESDEEDSDDGRTLMTGKTGFTRLTGRKGEMASISSSRTKKTDLKTALSAISSRAKTPSRTEIRLPSGSSGEVLDMLGEKVMKNVKFMDDEMEESDDDSGVMEFNDDGKLVIHDDTVQPENSGDSEQPPGKRRRISRFEQAKAVRDAKSKKRPHVPQLGAAYKSKKAGGDVKKKDQKFEPYAFVPLDGKSYSKKNRKNAVEQMTTVVKRGKRKR